MPPKAKASAKGRGKGAKNAHQLATRLPEGTILKDYTKGEWKLGQAVGSGGFGLIYLAAKNTSARVGPKAEYVIKVEPHHNGPLFCELHFYQRVAKPDLIKQWTSTHKLKSLGMPIFIAHGAYEDSNEKYRFMVMERFGTDLQKLFEENGKCFPRKTVITLGIRLLEILEYVHSREYCHADIKASNLLLGFQKAVENQVFLVDYGLAYRYVVDGRHKQYHMDPKWKHNGTIELTSRDAHNGLTPSRRGDLEILAYCLLQWLCGKLPWEDKLTDPVYVQTQKNKCMDDIPGFMKKCFPSGEKPAEIECLLQYINTLDYEEAPKYEQCKKILRDGLKKLGFADDGKLEFTSMGATPGKTAKTTPSKRVPTKQQRKRQMASVSEDENGDVVPSPAKKGRKKVAAPAESEDEIGDCVQSPAKKGRKRVASPATAPIPTVHKRKTTAKSPRSRIPNAAVASPNGDIGIAKLVSPGISRMKTQALQELSSDPSFKKKTAGRSPKSPSARTPKGTARTILSNGSLKRALAARHHLASRD